MQHVFVMCLGFICGVGESYILWMSLIAIKEIYYFIKGGLNLGINDIPFFRIFISSSFICLIIIIGLIILNVIFIYTMFWSFLHTFITFVY